MSLNLTASETRIIGCLMEKSVTTPDLYPLTLKALISASNQKSGRSPVMSLGQGEIQHTARALETKHLLRTEENFKSRAEKYIQRFCNTRYSNFQFDPSQFAIVCLLLLRGPQTPGELRAHSGRLHTFDNNVAVTDALATLIEWEGSPLVVELPRTPGRKDAEYMHLFSGPVDVAAHMEKARSTRPTGGSDRLNMAELAERVARLETEVAVLSEQLKTVL